MLLYKIKDWERYYEHDKRYVTYTWVKLPVKHDGKGFRRLISLPNGPALFGAWCLILEVAAKCTTRGVLADQDGPLSAEDIAFKTGAPEPLIIEALEVLCSERIAWMEIAPGDPQGIPVNPRESLESPVNPEASLSSSATSSNSAGNPSILKRTIDNSTVDQNRLEGGDGEPKKKRVPKQQKPEETDEQWLASLQAKRIYAQFNVTELYEKMVVWCETNRQMPTRRRFLNWLNRQDQIMTKPSVNGKATHRPVGLAAPNLEAFAEWDKRQEEADL